MTTPPPPSTTPFRPPPATKLWRDGAALVIRRNAVLPTGRCLRCQNPAVGLGNIPGSSKDPFKVALCFFHMRWIRWSPAIGSVLGVVGVVALVSGTGRGSVPVALLGFYLLIAAIVGATMGRGTLRTIGSNPHFIRVRGVSVRYLQGLHGWNDYPQVSA